jgi:acyl-CoA thioester hydrolase
MSQDAPSAGRFEGRVHILPVRIYYEDTDFTGLVYHANYVRYCERGRSDFLRLAGVHHSLLLAEAEPRGFAVNKLHLEFLKPARIDDALIVRSMFETIKGPRIFITEVQVCCISLTGKPKRPPGVLLDRLKPFLEPSASSF